jgi:hypothetical protein
VESFICKAIEIEPTCSLEPTIGIIVIWLICTTLSDLILDSGVKTSANSRQL